MKKILLILLITISPLFSFGDQFSIMAENDLTYHTDHYFTHGTVFQYTQDNNLGYSIGQNIYTPDDKKATYLIPNDRPYAGYLYGSIYNTICLENENEIFLECQMGMVGPDSYAEETQKWVHEKIHSEIPMGWDNQIPNHFAGLLIGKYTIHAYDNKYFAFDPYMGAIYQII